MKVRMHQLNPTIGDIKGNTALILDAIRQAEKDSIDLLVLPELVVCGYPPMDLLERRAFLREIYDANQHIIEGVGRTAVIFGSVTPNPSAFGRNCFNSALMAHEGELKAEIHKTLLPTYDVFDDLRYFEPNSEFECVNFKGKKLGITICEDIWHNGNDIQYHTYELNPVKELLESGADAIINISASPFTKTKSLHRLQMLQNHARMLRKPVFYVNQAGANTELVFDGDSMIIDAEAEIIARSHLFREDFIDAEWGEPGNELTNTGHPPAEVPEKTERIFRALILGLKDYLRKTGVTDRVIIGLSGGIDSALVTCIAAEALGPERVTAVTMPSEFSSKGSVDDSVTLTQNLGIRLHQLSVEDLYDRYLDTLQPLFKGTSFGVAEENIQSRIRGTLLMALSNKFGCLLLNAGNKSELATGYSTLYGDMAGGLGVISDLYKTEVFEMANWLNDRYYQREVIPEAILTKPPSAELRPDQKDTDTLPDYKVLDAVLEYYIEKQWSIAEIADQGFDADVISKIVHMVDRTEFKRYQAVPGLKVSTKAFGTGRRWPLVQSWTRS